MVGNLGLGVCFRSVVWLAAAVVVTLVLFALFLKGWCHLRAGLVTWCAPSRPLLVDPEPETVLSKDDMADGDVPRAHYNPRIYIYHTVFVFKYTHKKFFVFQSNELTVTIAHCKMKQNVLQVLAHKAKLQKTTIYIYIDI